MKTRDITPQVRSFLLQGARTGKIATVGPDRLPHVVPVWFHLDGDEIIFITSDQTMKAKNLLREGHVAMCVDDERPPFAYTEIEGDSQDQRGPARASRLGHRDRAALHRPGARW